jgi:hypothetical protein
MMRQAIEHHHQRFDGTGYPDGAKGEQIPLWARIICPRRRLRQHADRAIARRRRALPNRPSTNFPR